MCFLLECPGILWKEDHECIFSKKCFSIWRRRRSTNVLSVRMSLYFEEEEHENVFSQKNVSVF